MPPPALASCLTAPPHGPPPCLQSSWLGLGQLSPSGPSSLGHTLSWRSSLSTESSGPPSPTAAAATGTRGSLRDAPDFPLVLAWGGSSGMHSGDVGDAKEQAAAGGGGGGGG